MKVELKVKKEFEVKYLQVEANVRYWEDATVNGVEDENGELVPCRVGEIWKPFIEIETGKILNWTEGVEANIHYKVCDAGVYKLLDDTKSVVKEIDGYVPTLMSPKEAGFGDYIIMDINKNGQISSWKPVLKDFIEEEEY